MKRKIVGLLAPVAMALLMGVSIEGYNKPTGQPVSIQGGDGGALLSGGLNSNGYVKEFSAGQEGSQVGIPKAPMSPQLPVTASAGANTSVEVNGLPAGSVLRIACTSASFPLEIRSGIHPLTALVTDNPYYVGGSCPDGSANCITFTLGYGSNAETAIALISATGITCVVAVRNTP